MKHLVIAAMALTATVVAARAEDAPAATPASPPQPAPELQALGQMLNECQAARLSELVEMYRARAASARKPPASATPPATSPSEPTK